MIRMYLLLVAASVKSRMQHPFNFVFSTVIAIFVGAIEFLMIAVVLSRFGTMQGWSLNEIGYLYAMIMLCKAFYRIAASDVHNLEKYLISGELDQLLTRPVPVLLALMSQNFSFLVAELLQGGTILFISMGRLWASGQIGWSSVPYTIITLVTGTVILFAIALATATTGFWITRIRELQVVTEDSARFAAQYPMSLYPKWLQLMLLTLIPVGFANYVPALFILRGQFGVWVIGATALVAAVSLALSLVFWRYGLSKYQSAGS